MVKGQCKSMYNWSIYNSDIQSYMLHETCVVFQRVRIHFLSFNIRMSEGCIYDFANIYDGASTYAPRLRHLCGSTLPGDVVSSGNTIYIKFGTNNTHTYSGFRIQYTAIDGTILSLKKHTITLLSYV